MRASTEPTSTDDSSAMCAGRASDEAEFIAVAMSVGVGERIAALIAECDLVIATFPEDADQRWLMRVEAQRRALVAPNLALIAALSARLAEETPDAATKVAPALRKLCRRHPQFVHFCRRAETPDEAHLTPSRTPQNA